LIEATLTQEKEDQSSTILGLCQFVVFPACALWFVLVGLQLYHYGKRQVSAPVVQVAGAA
jgi:hypothetical protein